jgi:hypothetical protein
MRLKYLRTKPRKVIEASPCIAEMGAMIQCWTASGVDDAKCMQSAKMLADCMKSLVCSTTVTGPVSSGSYLTRTKSSHFLRTELKESKDTGLHYQKEDSLDSGTYATNSD